MEFPESIPMTGTENLVRSVLIFRRYQRSLNRSGVQKGSIDIANLVPIMDTGAVAQSMAMKDEKNLNVGMVSVEGVERSTFTERTMYLCLLLHLFTTDARVNLYQLTCNLPLTNLQRPEEIQEHLKYVINPPHGVCIVSSRTHERDRQFHMGSES